MSDVPLKEHIESRLHALEKATSIAASAMEKRLEGMNEFREQLRSQSASFVTRDYLDIRIEALEKNKRDNLALFFSIMALLTGIIGTVIAIVK